VAIVLDASSLIAKLTSSEDFAQQISDLTENEIVLAPDLIVLETISGMYKMSLRKEISNSLFNSLFMQVAREDIKLHQTVFQSQNTYVYSYTRLAIILEKKKLFQEALSLIEEALRLNLDDKTVNGYKGRKIRVVEKMQKVK